MDLQQYPDVFSLVFGYHPIHWKIWRWTLLFKFLNSIVTQKHPRTIRKWKLRFSKKKVESRKILNQRYSKIICGMMITDKIRWKYELNN